MRPPVWIAPPAVHAAGGGKFDMRTMFDGGGAGTCAGICPGICPAICSAAHCCCTYCGFMYGVPIADIP